MPRRIIFSVFSFYLLAGLLEVNVYAGVDTVLGVGRYHMDRRTTFDESCRLALQKSKENALSKAGFEKITAFSRDICSDVGSTAECRLYQDTTVTYSGGFISGYELESEKKLDGVHGTECEIRIIAKIKKYLEKPDPNFTVSAGVQTDILREGERLAISGEVTQPSYVYFLGFYPDIDSDHYYALGREQSSASKVQGKFTFPSEGSKEQVEVFVQFPKDFKRDTTYETVLVLASKKKLDILEKIKVTEFMVQLDILGRNKWAETRVGYAIVRSVEKKI